MRVFERMCGFSTPFTKYLCIHVHEYVDTQIRPYTNIQIYENLNTLDIKRIRAVCEDEIKDEK